MVMGLPFSGGIHACLVLDVNSEFEGEVMDTRHFIYRQCCIGYYVYQRNDLIISLAITMRWYTLFFGSLYITLYIAIING